ncbi:MAG TPA: hypothetical protein PLW86_07755 [Rhodocyclaceae bacterium]|nr:hypothetical protein [Rhodocyclaceae bacterium]
MKFGIRDLGKLRWHLLAALAAIIAGGLLAWWSTQVQLRTRQELQQTEGRAKAAEGRLQQVRSEEEEIRGKAALFVKLRDAGIIGPERRLDWTELLASLQQQQRLPGLEYEFSPQAPLDATNNGGYGYYKSTMKLRLQLLHEEDLLRFISTVEQRARALVITRSCKTARVPAAAGGAAASAQLTADCELEWITARKNGAK